MKYKHFEIIFIKLPHWRVEPLTPSCQGECVFQTATVRAKCSNIAKDKEGNKNVPARPEAPLKNRPEFVNAPYPTRSQKSVRPKLTVTKPTNNSITILPRHAPERKEMHWSHCEGMKGFLRQNLAIPPQKYELDLSLNVRERFCFLLEKYWQCGDKSHHNKEMHTLFNSILTYKKLFSTSL